MCIKVNLFLNLEIDALSRTVISNSHPILLLWQYLNVSHTHFFRSACPLHKAQSGGDHWIDEGYGTAVLPIWLPGLMAHPSLLPQEV